MRFTAMATDLARGFQAGGPDAYGLVPEAFVSDGDGVPCRHCLRQVPAGEMALVLAHRPFGALQPYAETGPVFLCAMGCGRGGGPDLPAILSAPDYILRGYDTGERIVYGTGGVIPTLGILARAADLLADPRVAFVHVRSARNNCYQCRIDRD